MIMNGSATMSDDDIDSKVAKYRLKLEKQRREAWLLVQDQDIGAAIGAAYHKYGDVAINLPALTTLVFQNLGISSRGFQIMSPKIMDFIHNADWLIVTKGKAGGVRSL